LIAGAVGFCSGRAGIAGLLARGAMAAFGTQFVLDGLVPLGASALGGLSANNSRELDRASHRLATGLGRMGFDTLVSLPFAMGGSLAGRGLRSAFADVLETKATATAAAPKETRTTGAGNGEGRFRSYAADQAGQTGRRPTWTERPTSRVVVGELLDP